jgi:hypothetical protein
MKIAGQLEGSEIRIVHQDSDITLKISGAISSCLEFYAECLKQESPKSVTI